jgi:predicted metalloprotease
LFAPVQGTVHQAGQGFQRHPGTEAHSGTGYNRHRSKLQADFLAGVWAHFEQKKNHILDKGDIDEALNAANAIGDDRLQKEKAGVVVPDAFTHGTSQQRVYWFRKGFETGDPRQGNTFDDPSLN